MALYSEKDGTLIRQYELQDIPVAACESEKALIEMVPTKAFGTTLFIDNVLQFALQDEYIYHEMLVHPCLCSSEKRERICIIGGGDGCALREVLKWHDVKHVDLIDWDKAMTDAFSTKLGFYNDWAFEDKRVHIENKDILECCHERREYDCILVDLLDPDESQSDLWNCIIECVKRWILPHGSICINAGGILPWQTDTFNWLLQHIESTASLRRHAYKVFVPSFGKEWCFVLLNSDKEIQMKSLPSNLHYLDDTAWKKAYTYGWTKDYLNRIHGLF